ncbi:MAG TPA: TatD family hydrolase, partial [Rhodocyclaceae bacterium]|nr:TatD family hydrolase [Rhodocyclaceae bacterium]
MLIDTHCHLDAVEFDADRDEVVVAARRAGVRAMMLPAVERANFAAVAALCRDYADRPVCAPAYGIHPLYVARAQADDLATLETLCALANADVQPVAVGEIGLDRFVAERDDALQTQYFTAQLQIARRATLPVLLHGRRAMDQVLYHLRRIPVVGGIIHAFNGSRRQADEFIRLGFKLGFGGAMTFPRAHRIRELAATLPLEAIVLETDAPDIPPEWIATSARPRNSPDQLPRIAAVLAE